MNEELRPGENPEVNNVSGYRKLTDKELNLVNAMKADGPMIEHNIESIKKVITETSESEEQRNERLRSLALGKTKLQEAYMWLIRAVAAPKGIV